MTKTLIKHGNSLALIIDKPILELLQIDERTLLEISTIDGKSLQIRPAQKPDRRAKFESALQETNQKFGKTLKKLA